jgi:hypothetical protein
VALARVTATWHGLHRRPADGAPQVKHGARWSRVDWRQRVHIALPCGRLPATRIVAHTAHVFVDDDARRGPLPPCLQVRHVASPLGSEGEPAHIRTPHPAHGVLGFLANRSLPRYAEAPHLGGMRGFLALGDQPRGCSLAQRVQLSFRVADLALPLVARLHGLHSGPRYWVRSRSSCPRSHGKVGSSQRPQRQQYASPRATTAAHFRRSA